MGKLQRIIVQDVAPPSRLLRIGQALRGIWSGPITSNSPEIARIIGAGLPVSSGVVVSEATALNYSAVWAAVSLISSQVGNLPCVLYRKTAAGKDRFADHPLYRLLHDRPNEEMSAFSFREALQAHVLTWGGGYAEIERDSANRPVALWPLTPDRVQPTRVNGVLWYRVTQSPDGQPVFLPKANTLHIPGLSFDGITGYSVIQKARESIGLGLATERFGGSFFGNGSTFGGVFSHPTRLSEQARKNFVEAVNRQHQGVDRAHKFMVVEEGMTYAKLGIPPNDAQFIESRKFQVDEIARWFNLPPHKLKELERSTNNNIEHQNLEYYIDCLAPWLERWEQELNEKLVSKLERNMQEIEFIVDGLLRGDSIGRGESYSKQFSVGALTPNDVRESENRNKIDGGADAFVPMNVIPLALARDYWQASIEKTRAETKKTLEPPPPAPAAPDPNLQRELDTARRCLQEEKDARERETAEHAEVLRQQTATAEAARVEAARAYGAEMDAMRAREATTGGVILAIDAERTSLKVNLATAETAATELRIQVAAVDALAKEAIEKLAGAREDLGKATEQREQAQATIASLEKQGNLLSETAERQAKQLIEAAAVAHAAVTERLAWIVDHESSRALQMQGSPEKLRRWVEQFYADFAETCRAILTPTVRTWIACTAHPEPLEHLLTALIEPHIAQSVRQLRQVAEEHDAETMAPALAKLLRRWETNRATDTVRSVLTEG